MPTAPTAETTRVVHRRRLPGFRDDVIVDIDHSTDDPFEIRSARISASSSTGTLQGFAASLRMGSKSRLISSILRITNCGSIMVVQGSGITRRTYSAPCKVRSVVLVTAKRVDTHRLQPRGITEDHPAALDDLFQEERVGAIEDARSILRPGITVAVHCQLTAGRRIDGAHRTHAISSSLSACVRPQREPKTISFAHRTAQLFA